MPEMLVTLCKTNYGKNLLFYVNLDTTVLTLCQKRAAVELAIIYVFKQCFMPVQLVRILITLFLLISHHEFPSIRCDLF